MQGRQSTERLVAALPKANPEDFVNPPEVIDRFLVRIGPDGTLYFKGSRARVDEFVQRCIKSGLNMHVDHLSLCG